MRYALVMGSRLGTIAAAAVKAGLTLEEYQRRRTAGLKRCIKCHDWLPVDRFKADRSRGDGLGARCRECDYTPVAEPRPNVNPATGRPGPAPRPPRAGDKRQARQRINVEVRDGRRAHPNTLPCAKCGHVWQPGERRHEYDHHLGYAAEHHYDVQPLCTKCHHAKDGMAARTTCKRGHDLTTPDAFRIDKAGRRFCLLCAQAKERARGPRGSDYWKRINEKRRGKSGRSE